MVLSFRPTFIAGLSSIQILTCPADQALSCCVTACVSVHHPCSDVIGYCVPLPGSGNLAPDDAHQAHPPPPPVNGK